MSYKARPIFDNPAGLTDQINIQLLDIERAFASGELRLTTTTEEPNRVEGYLYWFKGVAGYSDGMYFWDGSQWVEVGETTIDVQAFTVDGTGDVWTDLNLMDFTGQTDAQPNGTVLVDTSIFVTFYHNGTSYSWGGPRPVNVGLNGNHTAVEADLIPLGVANLVTSVHGRQGDVVGQSGDYTYDQVGADQAGSAAAVQADLDAHKVSTNPHGKVTWKGGWSGGQYEQYDMVEDTGWLMIANKITTDRPAPQAIGPVEWATDLFGGLPAWASDAINTSTLILGQRYTFTAAEFLHRARFWVYYAPNIQYELWIVENPTGNPTYEQVIAPFSPDPEDNDTWVEIPLGGNFVVGGTTFDLVLIIRAVAAEVSFNGTWDYNRSNGNPGIGEIWHQSAGGGAEIRVHERDSALQDRTAELNNIGPGDVIAIPGYTWNVLSASKNGAIYSFDVQPATRASNGSYLFTFTYYQDALINYDRVEDFWSAVPEVNGLVSTTGYPDGLTINEHAYPLDIQIQEASVSDDWDFLAVSAGASGSGGGGGDGEVNDGANVGSGVGIYRDKTGTAINLKSLRSDNSSITIQSEADTVNLRGQSWGGANVGSGAGVYRDTVGSLHNLRRIRSSDSTILVQEESNSINLRITNRAGTCTGTMKRPSSVQYQLGGGWREFTYTGWNTYNLNNCEIKSPSYRFGITPTSGTFTGVIMLTGSLRVYGPNHTCGVRLYVNGSYAANASVVWVASSLTNQGSSNWIEIPFCVVQPMDGIDDNDEFGLGIYHGDTQFQLWVKEPAILINLRED